MTLEEMLCSTISAKVWVISALVRTSSRQYDHLAFGLKIGCLDSLAQNSSKIEKEGNTTFETSDQIEIKQRRCFPMHSNASKCIKIDFLKISAFWRSERWLQKASRCCTTPFLLLPTIQARRTNSNEFQSVI